ncbi:MAG: protein-export chaperone SecB [Brachymonas sp.]|nr:protein-export chaperone SecB [Brachymonas sp.]
MADATQDSQEPVFSIQRVYLKEASLEQPNSPAILLEQEQPGVEIQIGVEGAQIADGVFEVGVTGTVHTKVKERTLFLAEVKQAGIFEIRGLTQEQVAHALEVACPQIVFPYLRGNVADLIQRAGFPPVHLGEINFQGMQEQRREEEAKGANNGTGNGHAPDAANE